MSQTTPVKPKILIFEDDRDLVAQWTACFNKHNYDVINAVNIIQAEFYCKQYQFELIIVDMFIVDDKSGELSNQGGISFLHYLKQPILRDFPEYYQKVPKIGVTGAKVVHQFDMLDLAREYGCNVTLRKPFLPEKLLNIALELIQAHNS